MKLESTDHETTQVHDVSNRVDDPEGAEIEIQ